MIRSFVDSNVLIAASRKDQLNATAALRFLASPSRRFRTSVFVRLEVYRKVAFHSFPLQRALMNEFFMDSTIEWAQDLPAMATLALHLVEVYNTSAMDSLHLAAAIVMQANEFVTTEKPGRPMYNVQAIRVRRLEDIDDI